MRSFRTSSSSANSPPSIRSAPVRTTAGAGGLPAVSSYQWNLGDWHPFIGPVGGYILGKGVEDGFILGPEVGLKYDVARNWALYARAGYGHNFRNELNQGIFNGALGAAYRF